MQEHEKQHMNMYKQAGDSEKSIHKQTTTSVKLGETGSDAFGRDMHFYFRVNNLTCYY